MKYPSWFYELKYVGQPEMVCFSHFEMMMLLVVGVNGRWIVVDK